MGWVTVYITGKSDFRDDVLKKLQGSDLQYMPGYTGGTGDYDAHDLYWLDDRTDIRKMKEAIGSKLVFRHRLNFYPSLEAFIESQHAKRKQASPEQEQNELLAQLQAADH